jgi:hypothetical protein
VSKDWEELKAFKDKHWISIKSSFISRCKIYNKGERLQGFDITFGARFIVIYLHLSLICSLSWHFMFARKTVDDSKECRNEMKGSKFKLWVFYFRTIDDSHSRSLIKLEVNKKSFSFFCFCSWGVFAACELWVSFVLVLLLVVRKKNWKSKTISLSGRLSYFKLEVKKSSYFFLHSQISFCLSLQRKMCLNSYKDNICLYGFNSNQKLL